MENKNIVSCLPRGSQTRIAEKFGISKQAVNKILHGIIKGPKANDIFNEAQLLIKQKQQSVEASLLRKQINEMSDAQLLKWAKKS